MKKTNATDAARIELLLAELRLPAMKLMWADLAARADKEGWPASRFLAALAEHCLPFSPQYASSVREHVHARTRARGGKSSQFGNSGLVQPVPTAM